MQRLEQITALVVLGMSAVTVLATRDLAIWTNFTPGPRFVPLIVAGVAAFLSVALLISAARRSADPQVDWPKGADAVRVASIATAIILFAAAVEWLGFVTCAFLFVTLVLTVILRRPVVPALFAATLVTSLIYVVFIAWLKIRLPTGIFGF